MDLNNLGTSIFATGIGAAVITQLKGWLGNIGHLFHFGYEFFISDTANQIFYDFLLNEMSNYAGNFHKTTSFSSTKYQYGRSLQKDKEIIGFGTFLLHPYKKIFPLIFLNHGRVEKEVDGENHTISIKLYGPNAKKYYQELKEKIKELTDETCITLINDGVRSRIQKRTFDTIFHPQVQNIYNFLNTFKNSKSFYQEHGLSYKTGLFLHGPAGTGKTSIVKAVATFLNYDIVVVNSLDYIADDMKSADHCVILFDDIDKLLFSDVKNSNDIMTYNTKNTVNQKLHFLLQFLDGINNRNDVVFIATSNHFDVIQNYPELIREGRFDLKVELGNIDEESANKMCEFFGEKLDEIMPNCEFPINPTYLQSKILQKKKGI